MKHTPKNIRRTGEFVVNLADEGTANAMHASSAELPESESEFARAGLTAVPARMVKHPRIGEAAASLECRVERRIEFGPERELVIRFAWGVAARRSSIAVGAGPTTCRCMSRRCSRRLRVDFNYKRTNKLILGA